MTFPKFLPMHRTMVTDGTLTIALHPRRSHADPAPDNLSSAMPFRGNWHAAGRYSAIRSERRASRTNTRPSTDGNSSSFRSSTERPERAPPASIRLYNVNGSRRRAAKRQCTRMSQTRLSLSLYDKTLLQSGLPVNKNNSLEAVYG